MNKIKEAIELLRTYLGRDAEGLKRLDRISQVANEQRKELATVRESAAQAVAAKKSVEEKLLARDLELTNARLDMEREVSQHKQALRDLEAARAEIQRLQAEVEKSLPEDLPPLSEGLNKPRSQSPFVRDLSLMTTMVNQLRRDIRVAPKRVYQTVQPVELASVYELTDIIQDFSQVSLIRMGRFVCASAMFNFPIIVVAQDNVLSDDIGIMGFLPRKALSDPKLMGPVHKYIDWLRPKKESRTETEQKCERICNPLEFTNLATERATRGLF